MLMTTPNSEVVGLICSYIPWEDETNLVDQLKTRSDLDTLFTLYCKPNISAEHSGDISAIAEGIKAREVWRVLRFPSGNGAPWDWNWQPPLSGDPYEIANEFHIAVSRAMFRIPILDLVRFALGYNNALYVKSLCSAARDVSSGLRSKFQHNCQARDIYIKVEKVRMLYPQRTSTKTCRYCGRKTIRWLIGLLPVVFPKLCLCQGLL
jgi:hypothetical protein